MNKSTQIYNLIYAVVLNDNMHLGRDKASNLANIVAVKSTWKIQHNPRAIMQFTSAFLQYCNKDNYGTV